FNGGLIIYSDLQCTSGRNTRSSSREDKIYQVGKDNILLAGTGSIVGIIQATELASKYIQIWKSHHDLRPILPFEIGEILRYVMDPNDEAWFLVGAYDHQRDQGYVADVECNGITWQSDLCQVNGSGSNYMISKAKDLTHKVLATRKNGKDVVITRDVYDALPALDFPREVALLEGLDVISAGPTADVFSGGNGYQAMVVDKNGTSEYILPTALAQEILTKKREAEFSAVHSRRKKVSFNSYHLFEQGRRR
ncbi:MAG: hypothetical protein Q8R37_00805, partial [Nanoarchaeota archaeon]|nr:hypothetical protein [Nanoarchaeota archaeon]